MHAPKTLVLGLGNDLLADDAVGIVAAQRLGPLLRGRADVVASPLHGLALLDLFIGYDRAVVIDAIQTGRCRPGTIMEIDPKELRSAPAPSPHFAGLPEMLALSRRLGVHFPNAVRIVAVEVADLLTIGAGMTPAVRHVLPELCRYVCRIIDGDP